MESSLQLYLLFSRVLGKKFDKELTLDDLNISKRNGIKVET